MSSPFFSYGSAHGGPVDVPEVAQSAVLEQGQARLLGQGPGAVLEGLFQVVVEDDGVHAPPGPSPERGGAWRGPAPLYSPPGPARWWAGSGRWRWAPAPG